MKQSPAKISVYISVYGLGERVRPRGLDVIQPFQLTHTDIKEALGDSLEYARAYRVVGVWVVIDIEFVMPIIVPVP